MIHGLAIFIEIEMPIGWHGSFDGLGIFHVKLLEHILGVLGLTNESAILELLDLKSEEEGQLTHHRHLKSLCHNPTKIIAPSFVSRDKYNVIDIYSAHKDIFINFASEESRIGFAYFKAFP